MLISAFPAGPWGTNCYVLASGPGEPCLIVDPGQGSGPILRDLLAEHHLAPAAVLLTHGHIDHTWCVAPLAASHGIPAFVHAADAYRLADPVGTTFSMARETLMAMTEGELELTEPPDVRPLEDGGVLDLAGLGLTVRHAPGHTEGSVVFLTADDDAPVMISGDVLFAGSIGRTDLPGGDPAAMERSLRDVVLPCPDQMRVLPGHGEATTIGRERSANPFLRHLADGGGLTPPTRGL